MTKIEIIWVSSKQNKSAKAVSILVERINELGTEFGPNELQVEKNRIDQSDIAVFIHWTNATDSEKSLEGLMVANMLEEIGAPTHIVCQS